MNELKNRKKFDGASIAVPAFTAALIASVEFSPVVPAWFGQSF
jgi:hypothetical protein